MKSIQNNTNDLSDTAKKVKKYILEISHKAQVGHIGPALSIADILTVLYFGVLNVNPKNPKNPHRDFFILSKGHAVSALWSVLALKGFFSKRKLFSYCQNNGYLGQHPEHNIKGVELTTGSLGHGLSVGVGLSMASKMNHAKNHTFVLISDAECNEGEVWEAALTAAHHNLKNLTVIIDYNKVQAFGTTKEVLNTDPLDAKWLAFGWNVIETDGHNIPLLYRFLYQSRKKQTKPTVIIANTIRGKGVSFMEHKLEWHYLTVNKKQYRIALKELNR